MNDWPARTDPEEAAIGRPTATARRLVEASVSPNTRRAYAGALRRLDVWLDGRELHDVTLAAYLAELHDAGRASSSASMAVAAACFRAKLRGQPSPAGERTARVLAGYRRTVSDRGRGQAPPFGLSNLAAVLATCHRPRRRGRGVESDQVAAERGRLDAVIAGLLFMAGMRRSEVSALRWADVVDSTDGAGVLVTVRRSKTNQEGETNDVRFVKDGVARALRTLRGATSPEPGDRVVPLSAQMIGLRFTAAAAAAAVESRVTAHSGRVGAGVGTHQPGRVDHRRNARRELEDQPHGGALLRWRDGGTWCRGRATFEETCAQARGGASLLIKVFGFDLREFLVRSVAVSNGRRRRSLRRQNHIQSLHELPLTVDQGLQPRGDQTHSVTVP